MTRSIGRRHALEMLLGLGVLAIGSSGAAGCAPKAAADDGSAPPFALPAQTPGGDVGARAIFADDVAALCDVLLPTERDAKGNVVAAGAAEVDVDGALRIDSFVAAATAAGLLPPLADGDVQRLSGAADAFRAALNAELAVLAARAKPLTAFRDLPRATQEQIVVDALADTTRKPLVLVVRAATFLAYLGAVTNDTGLRAVGFPPFESFEDARAVSGYPRTMSGKLLDATKDDLAAYAAKNDLDDYTYNRAPAATSGDDLTLVLDAFGDLL